MRRSSLLVSVSVIGFGLLASTSCKNGSTSSTSSTSTSSGSGGGGNMPPAKPAIGMQIATQAVTLTAGQETYQCWSFSVPSSAAIALRSIEPHVPTKGVHHYAIYTNSQAITNAGPYECSTMGPTWGLVSGGGVNTPGVTFPDGTAMTLPAGEQIVFQLHLLNPSTESVTVPAAYVNLVGTDETDLQAVGLLIAGTLNIDIPPQSTDLTVTGGCKAPFAMAHIFDTFPHMHQLGKRITASVTPAGASTPTMLSDQTWNFQDQGLYSVTGSAAMNDQVTVSCTYDNPTNNDVQFGLSTNNEMCINVLYYYPASNPSTYCGLE